jgi:hypothetical protein
VSPTDAPGYPLRYGQGNHHRAVHALFVAVNDGHLRLTKTKLLNRNQVLDEQRPADQSPETMRSPAYINRYIDDCRRP